MMITISDENKCLLKEDFTDAQVQDIIYYAKCINQPVGKEINNLMRLYLPEDFIDAMLVHVCKYFHVNDFKGVKSRSRKKEFVVIRSIIFYRLVKYYKYTTGKAGKYFFRDHATVIHSLKKVEKYFLNDYLNIFQNDVVYAGPDSINVEELNEKGYPVNIVSLKVCEHYLLDINMPVQSIIKHKNNVPKSMAVYRLVKEHHFSFSKVADIFHCHIIEIFSCVKKVKHERMDEYLEIFQKDQLL
jgi:hypothetical protein